METIMELMKQLSKICIPMALIIGATAGGCAVSGEMEGRPADEFLGVDEESAVTRLANEQVAAGARTDLTLRPYHFDGGDLNSLGKEKLDFIFVNGDNKSGEKAVYIDAAAGDDAAGQKLAQARHDAVKDYLLSMGLAENSFRLESGYNPNNTSAAALPKSAGAEGDSAPAGANGAAGNQSVSKSTTELTNK
jgi:hypothetical protein